MKTSLVAIVITFAGIASGRQATTQPQTQPAAPAQTQPAAAQPQQKKEIKDPAEYNAYVGAVQQKDPTAKISGLEAFMAQYPNSVMKEDALELLMVSYQQTNNQAKMLDTAQRILQVNPNNLRALALLAYIKRSQAEAGGPDAQKNLTDGAQYAERGLQALQTAPKPDGTSDADFTKMKTQMSVIFNGVTGMAALQAKNYPQAQQRLREAVQADPNDLRNVYPLALADLTGTPPNTVEGLFFIARAANLATGAGQTQIESYGKSQYVKYHGSDQGWTDVMAAAKANPMPPAGFTVVQYVPLPLPNKRPTW